MLHELLAYIEQNMTAVQFLTMFIMMIIMAPLAILGSYTFFNKLIGKIVNEDNTNFRNRY